MRATYSPRSYGLRIAISKTPSTYLLMEEPKAKEKDTKSEVMETKNVHGLNCIKLDNDMARTK